MRINRFFAAFVAMFRSAFYSVKDRRLQTGASPRVVGESSLVRLALLFLTPILSILLAASAVAQSPAPQDSIAGSGHAPIQRVHPARKPFRAARLTFLTGNVVVEQASSKTQDVAVLNMPLVEGTALTTGDDGQAEIEFEDGSLIRLTPNSGVSLLNLTVDGSGNYQTRVSVLSGLVYGELRAGTKYQYSVDAGGDVVTPVENTTVRLNLDEPPAQIAVLQGAIHLTSVNGPSTIDADAGQTARSDAEQQGAPFVVREEIAAESWDQWNEDRDQAAASEAGTQTAARDQYAGDQGYGWSDLDANGSWYNVPGKGEVWQPDAAADDAAAGTDSSAGAGLDAGASFDPYGYGSWVWTPAGYSWASGYGWGWLPYRCGQWAFLDGFGWGWQPGISCGVFGFGGFGYGGYGYNINVGRAPGYFRHPKRPIPGPGPVHPIIHGPVGTAPIGIARSYGDGRLVRVKTIDGRSVEPLAPVASISSLRGSAAIGSALKRDYPVSTATHEPALGTAPTHTAPAATFDRAAWQQQGSAPGTAYSSGRRPPAAGRSNMLPAWPAYNGQTVRPTAAPPVRQSQAPAPRSSAPAASPSRAASPSSTSSPQHK